LAARRVTTFGGSGEPGDYRSITGGPDTLLSSPWDLEVVDNLLYVAMAGTHQIWRAAVETRNFRPFAGSGIAHLSDGPGPSAQLAQPSGLSAGDEYLYFADSEASAVRRANLLSSGQVETLVGRGLFEFGDRTGPAGQARLQHPLGVHWHDGRVYIADTYNHRIKVLHPRSLTVDHVVGMGRPGGGDGPDAGLYEPADVAVANGRLYIADTNNHRIAVLEHNSEALRTLPITFS
jgi:hypothetical protein